MNKFAGGKWAIICLGAQNDPQSKINGYNFWIGLGEGQSHAHCLSIQKNANFRIVFAQKMV